MDIYYLQDAQAPISAIGLYNDLCRRIISAELKPGAKISENTISAEYGISRSVLRTVFARLQQINLIDVYPQRGTFVRLLDIEYVQSASKVRYMLNCNAVYDIVLKHPSESLMNDLQDMLCQMREALVRGSEEDMLNFITLNARYHLRIIQESFTANTLSLLYEIRVHLTRWCNIEGAMAGLEYSLLQQDQDIYDAIKDRKLQKALGKIREHFEMLMSNADALKHTHPEYFK